jgi:hypothetical protein
VRKEVDVNGREVLLFWYRNQIYCIQSRSPAEGAYSEGFIRAKFTQVRLAGRRGAGEPRTAAAGAAGARALRGNELQAPASARRRPCPAPPPLAWAAPHTPPTPPHPTPPHPTPPPRPTPHAAAQDFAIECPSTGSLFSLKDGAVLDWYPNNKVLRALTPRDQCKPLEVRRTGGAGGSTGGGPSARARPRRAVQREPLRAAQPPHLPRPTRATRPPVQIYPVKLDQRAVYVDVTQGASARRDKGGAGTSLENNNVFTVQPTVYFEGMDPRYEEASLYQISSEADKPNPAIALAATVALGIIAVAGTATAIYYEVRGWVADGWRIGPPGPPARGPRPWVGWVGGGGGAADPQAARMLTTKTPAPLQNLVALGAFWVVMGGIAAGAGYAYTQKNAQP